MQQHDVILNIKIKKLKFFSHYYIHSRTYFSKNKNSSLSLKIKSTIKKLIFLMQILKRSTINLDKFKEIMKIIDKKNRRVIIKNKKKYEKLKNFIKHETFRFLKVNLNQKLNKKKRKNHKSRKYLMRKKNNSRNY